MAYELVVIGVSSGGLKALQTVLGGLRREFRSAVAIVQHRDRGSGDLLGELLKAVTFFPVSESEDKEGIMAGHIYLAPPDYHLLVEDRHFSLSTEEPRWFARPSIDVLFESAAEAYGERLVGVILTGANRDGAQGLAAIAANDGLAVVQDPETAEKPDMPRAALAAVAEARVLPLEEIGPFLSEVCGPEIKMG